MSDPIGMFSAGVNVLPSALCVNAILLAVPAATQLLAASLYAAASLGLDGLGVADVDDSILNFVGALAGWIVVRLCQLICAWVKGVRK